MSGVHNRFDQHQMMFARTRMHIGRQDLDRPSVFRAPHDTCSKIRRARGGCRPHPGPFVRTLPKHRDAA